MNLIAHILVALVYVGALACYFMSEKYYTLFFAINASVALVLSGLSASSITYVLCIALSCLNFVLLGLILIGKKKIPLFTAGILQVPLIALWIIYYFR